MCNDILMLFGLRCFITFVTCSAPVEPRAEDGASARKKGSILCRLFCFPSFFMAHTITCDELPKSKEGGVPIDRERNPHNECCPELFNPAFWQLMATGLSGSLR